MLSTVCLLFGCALPFLNAEQTRSWLVCGEAVFALALLVSCFLSRIAALHQSCNGFCCNQCDRLHDQCSDLAAANERNRADRDLLYTAGFWLVWLTDTGAYLFPGSPGGKHKLARKSARKRLWKAQWAAWCSVLPQCFCCRLVYQVDLQQCLGRFAFG